MTPEITPRFASFPIGGAHSDRSDICIFKKNEVIFREKDASGCMYDIRWGKGGIFLF